MLGTEASRKAVIIFSSTFLGFGVFLPLDAQLSHIFGDHFFGCKQTHLQTAVNINTHLEDLLSSNLSAKKQCSSYMKIRMDHHDIPIDAWVNYIINLLYIYICICLKSTNTKRESHIYKHLAKENMNTSNVVLTFNQPRLPYWVNDVWRGLIVFTPTNSSSPPMFQPCPRRGAHYPHLWPG